MEGFDLGLDIGTSEVKAVLIDATGDVVAQAASALPISRPHPLWSEQNPHEWWRASMDALAKIRNDQPRAFAAVKGLGLSGQMHGATLLDRNDDVLRPAILWNDGRSAKQCGELERSVGTSRQITGNLAMPGFTAPKLLWVREHEPETFRAIARVLLPKDYVRLRLTGEAVSDMSDASGTLWLDVARRDWSDVMLDATGLTRTQMPRLVEGSADAGRLRPSVADELGLARDVVVAGGAGDNAASAAGLGVTQAGSAFLSLGTSGVFFVAGDAFAPNPERAVHAFCHCFPATWHQMSVMLSAASCLQWLRHATGADSEAQLVEEASTALLTETSPIFLPYLSGERTPHNNPNASGVFYGLSHDCGRAQLALAVLEGVAFAFADGQRALFDGGARIDAVTLVGGGSRSAQWAQLLADVLGRPLDRRHAGEVGAALGAARLARMARSGASVADACAAPPLRDRFEPDRSRADLLAQRGARFRRLYAALAPEMQPTA